MEAIFLKTKFVTPEEFSGRGKVLGRGVATKDLDQLPESGTAVCSVRTWAKSRENLLIKYDDKKELKGRVIEGYLA